MISGFGCFKGTLFHRWVSMVYGVRTGISLAFGLVIGVVLSLILFPSDEAVTPGLCPDVESPSLEEEPSSEHWEVIIKKATTTSNNAQSQSGKVDFYPFLLVNYWFILKPSSLLFFSEFFQLPVTFASATSKFRILSCQISLTQHSKTQNYVLSFSKRGRGTSVTWMRALLLTIITCWQGRRQPPYPRAVWEARWWQLWIVEGLIFSAGTRNMMNLTREQLHKPLHRCR